jgi:hypothetical protein
VLGDATDRANHSHSPSVPAPEDKGNPPDISEEEYLDMMGVSDKVKKQVLKLADALASGDHPEKTKKGNAAVVRGSAAKRPRGTNAAPTSAGSKKRKAESSLDEEIATYKQDLDEIVDPQQFEDDDLISCAALRGKINRLLDSRIMTKTDFCKAIRANGNTLNNFLQKTGTSEYPSRATPIPH